MVWVPLSQLISGEANLCVLVTFPWSAHFYLAFSGDLPPVEPDQVPNNNQQLNPPNPQPNQNNQSNSQQNLPNQSEDLPMELPIQPNQPQNLPTNPPNQPNQPNPPPNQPPNYQHIHQCQCLTHNN